MRAVVVYESMFGNTRAIAESIADGLRSRYAVAVLPVGRVKETDLVDASLLVVGGPTHAWGMSRPATRRGALQQIERSGGKLVLEPGATESGLREWMARLHRGLPAAVFDTRADKPRAFTGAAGPKIARALRQHGCRIVAPPESFRVTSHNVLVAGERDRAHDWGARLSVRDVTAESGLPTR